ncbi:hypothetical protein C8R46DRAFT_1223895 [Mycena filopes]|nr:hypothetical protein C8R46DRAFT_1223895 [Mycena filopes]
MLAVRRAPRPIFEPSAIILEDTVSPPAIVIGNGPGFLPYMAADASRPRLDRVLVCQWEDALIRRGMMDRGLPREPSLV